MVFYIGTDETMQDIHHVVDKDEALTVIKSLLDSGIDHGKIHVISGESCSLTVERLIGLQCPFKVI